MTKTARRQSTTELQATFPHHCPRSHIPPDGFSAMKMSAEQHQLLEQQALEIFTAMANKRRPFADCLATVFLTGFEWGLHAKDEPEA